MKKLALIAALMLSTAAYGGEITGTDTPSTQAIPAGPIIPTPPQPPFFFMMDNADLAVIASALNELKKKEADPFLMKLQGQLNDQAKIKAEATKGK